MATLQDLFEDQIKDLYSAENQLLKAMPKVAKKISSEMLRKAVEKHKVETEGQVERLKKIAEGLEIKPTGKVCAAMKGLIEECQEALEEHDQGPILDAALVACMQRVEHYEISGYGTARTLAEHLGNASAAKLLQQTLKEESATDEKLTQVVERDVYPSADTMSDEMEEAEA
ncbi:MAG TPA: ferritin-like domain-containing protein [Humisphaera sp.]